MPADETVPQPGPARISPGGGPDEWLEAAKQCKYLPEPDIKRLCEIVKEYLMEGVLLVLAICTNCFVVRVNCTAVVLH